MSLVKIGSRFSFLLQNSVLLGRLALRFSIWYKRIALLKGIYDQRAIEYPWVLSVVRKYVSKGSRVLDVGCAESAFSHELVALGYDVWCVDINEPMFAPKSVSFIRADVREIPLSSNFFDAIIVVSTIEHIGMPVYGQEILEEDGDIKAIRELKRICKPGGYIILTTPFRGRELVITPNERQYSMDRINTLIEDFEPVAMNFYAPKREGKKIVWIEIPEEKAGNIQLEEPGIACLVIRKPNPQQS